jgi:Dimethlysulfonioproprionate lyase
MSDAARLIHSPPGPAGSGRVRYGAAMALWRDALITAEVLEVYRVAAAHDTCDPLQILRDLALPLPPQATTTPPLTALYSAARDYLLALEHPGAAEVRAGLPADPGVARSMTARNHEVVGAWLEPALRVVATDQPELARAIAGAADRLAWDVYDGYPRDQIGDDWALGHATATILGDGGPFAADDFDLGLFLIAPDVLYRDRAHAAPELYAPLTGPHGWRFGVGRPLIVKPAHEPVWNPAHRPHLTKVGSVPFLCLYVWTRDVNELAVVLPADDWAALEETRIV